MAQGMKGLFITFEGAEGSGKSTQAQMACRYLKEQNKPVVHIREPGGVTISEDIRNILLDVKNKRMANETEVLLYMAARAQLVAERIQPELQKGMVVMCDRYLDSTLAYQGHGNGVDMEIIQAIGRFATCGIVPDLTLLFDIDAREGLKRISRQHDRIESRALDYHQRVRQGYLEMAKAEPQRFRVISASGEKHAIQKQVRQHIDRLLEDQHGRDQSASG